MRFRIFILHLVCVSNMRFRMNWIFYIRKHVLGLTQGQLAEELFVNQTTVSRCERQTKPETLPRDSFIHLIDLVKSKTGKSLPAMWFFKTPEQQVLEGFFAKEGV